MYKIFPNYLISGKIFEKKKIMKHKKCLYNNYQLLMHWLLFIHKILFSSTRFEPQVLIFRRIQLYTCSIWYCHPPTTFPLQSVLTQAVYWQATRNSHREWQYHMLHVYNCILLNISTWGSKHVEENSILRINNNQFIKVGNQYIVSSWCTVRKTSRR